jgi:hypothetical protein
VVHTTKVRPPEPVDAQALIQQARRRQRRRRAAIVTVIVVAAGATWFAIAARGGGGAAVTPTHTAQRSPGGRTPTSARLIPRGVDTALLLWGPGPSYVDNLSTRQLLSKPAILRDIAGGDYQPLAAVINDKVVFAGGGLSVVGGDLTGRPRTLARTPLFAPAARPGHVWLGSTQGRRRSIRLASLTGSTVAPAIDLPRGTALVRGTDAGLLLENYRSPGEPLELWKPGHAAVMLPHAPSWADGFAATSRLIASGTGCRTLSPTAAYQPDVCRTLHVFNVTTRQDTSFSSPRGTLGWVPFGFNLVDAIARSGSELAAAAAIPPRHADRGVLYTVSLRHPANEPTAVPGSQGSVRSRLAWSIHGGWLFYQGPNQHLSAYQPRTGQVRVSKTPCCGYTVMAAVPATH